MSLRKHQLLTLHFYKYVFLEHLHSRFTPNAILLFVSSPVTAAVLKRLKITPFHGIIAKRLYILPFHTKYGRSIISSRKWFHSC